MNSPLRRIEQLIAADDLAAALAELAEDMTDAPGDLKGELVQHQATLAKVNKDRRQGLIDDARESLVLSRLRHAILGLAQEHHRRQAPAASLPAGSATPAGAARPRPKVFISYSRTDADLAREVKAALESNQIQGCIDEQDIAPGEDIAAFIHRAVGAADVVLSIVSERSLLSPWVGMEGVHALYDEALRGGRKLIACYLDTGFLDLQFRLTATDRIDARIAEIDALLPGYAERQLDTSDLNREKTRLFDLRNNLGRILDRLRGALAIDLRAPARDQGLARLVAAILAIEN